jgi:DsbC/DsbD-like thiol-disulfide interchange protein
MLNKNMKKIILSAVVLYFTLAVQAQIENPVKWTYTAKKITADTYELHITATIANKWHVYAQDAGEGPVPTAIVFDKNPLIKLDGTIREDGKLLKQFDKNFKSTLKFYSTKVDFVQKIKLKTAINTVAKGKVTFMVCNDEKCLPPKDVTFAIKINPKG